MRLALATTLAAAAFLLNPLAIGCMSSNDPEFTFSDTELRAALAGEWTLTTAQGASTVRFEQSSTSPTASRSPTPSLISTAHACGTRTLIASANACIDVTEMPLRIVVLDGPLASSSSIAGTLRVYGTAFVRGDLALTASGATANVQISPTGEILEQSGDFALARK